MPNELKQLIFRLIPRRPFIQELMSHWSTVCYCCKVAFNKHSLEFIRVFKHQGSTVEALEQGEACYVCSGCVRQPEVYNWIKMEELFRRVIMMEFMDDTSFFFDFVYRLVQCRHLALARDDWTTTTLFTFPSVLSWSQFPNAEDGVAMYRLDMHSTQQPRSWHEPPRARLSHLTYARAFQLFGWIPYAWPQWVQAQPYFQPLVRASMKKDRGGGWVNEWPKRRLKRFPEALRVRNQYQRHISRDILDESSPSETSDSGSSAGMQPRAATRLTFKVSTTRSGRRYREAGEDEVDVVSRPKRQHRV